MNFIPERKTAKGFGAFIYEFIHLFFHVASCCCPVAKCCPNLHKARDCSMTGFPVLHCSPGFPQIHVHWVVMLPNHLIKHWFYINLSATIPEYKGWKDATHAFKELCNWKDRCVCNWNALQQVLSWWTVWLGMGGTERGVINFVRQEKE